MNSSNVMYVMVIVIVPFIIICHEASCMQANDAEG